MESQKPRDKAPIILVLVVLLLASISGMGYFFYQASSLQNLDNARSSIKVVAWISTYSGTSYTYGVKVTNGNSFDVTLTQLTISVIDTTGTEVSGNTIAPRVVITAGNSITTQLSVNIPSNGWGHNIHVIIATPYGDVTIGSG